MKSYLLKRSNHYLFILVGGLIGILLAVMFNKEISLNHENIYLFKWMGMGLLLSEIVLFINWYSKKDKS